MDIFPILPQLSQNEYAITMWVVFALAGAVTKAVQNILIKNSGKHFTAVIVTWGILVVSAFLYLPLFYLGGHPHLTIKFLTAVILRLILDTIALLLFIRGIHEAPVSLVMPMAALLPLFLLFSSLYINNLFPTPLGIVGVIVTVVGIYFLHFDHGTKHPFSPFKAMYSHLGIRFVFIATVLWSITVSLNKVAIHETNTYFFTAFFQLVWATLFTPLAYFFNKDDFAFAIQTRNLKKLIPIGALDAQQVLLANIALTLSLPVYVQSVEASSLLFAMILGWYFFKEKISHNIVPTICILIGIVIIAFAQR